MIGRQAPQRAGSAEQSTRHRTELARSDVRHTIISQGGDVVASTPEAFDKVVCDDVTRIAGLVKNAGLRAD